MEDALFLLCPWFLLRRVFYTVTSFNEASEDSVFLILSCVPFHLPYERKCLNKVASGDEEAAGHERPEVASGDEEAAGRERPEVASGDEGASGD